MWLIALAIVVAGAVGALTDWLFMGVLFHDAYNRWPEIWRDGVRDGQSRGAIIASSALGFVSSAAMIALCGFAHVQDLRAALIVSGLVFLAGPFLVVVVNGLFVKFDRRITLSHCLGYLARIVIAGVAAVLIAHF